MTRLLKLIVTLFQFQRTNWRAAFLCFLAAALFWVFNALSKSYATNVVFPLQILYDTNRYAPAAPLPGRLALNVSGNGWDLLRKQLGMRMPVVTVPVDRPAETRKIATANLLPVLASQVGALTINFPVTDSLRFHIETRDRHRFKVAVAPGRLTFRGNLGRVSQIVVLPDSVEVEGPTSLLHALPDSVLVVLPPDRIAGNYRQRHEVILRDEPLLSVKPETVEILFEVAGMRDITLRVRLQHTRRTMPDSVTCQLRVPAHWVETLPEITSAVYAVLPAAPASGKVLPHLRGLPEVVTVIRVDSVALSIPEK